ncbi:hypothetical protein [Hoeflea sp.]|uniref:hypothetical protein n=1 Tax=Hoeflea sp. TaxID=1940281 RepID=UPI003B016A6C
MAFVEWGEHEGGFDEVMSQLCRWLVRHLGDPKLLLWATRQDAHLHPAFARQIGQRLDYLASLMTEGNTEKVECIKTGASRAVPDQQMRTLWRLVLTDRIKSPPCGGLDKVFLWRQQFEREGLTTALRLELRDILRPCLRLLEPFRWPLQLDAGGETQGQDHLRNHVGWDVELSANHVREALDGLNENENWVAALPMLLDDMTGLLRDILDLKSELGDANKKHDGSYEDMASISEHNQNSKVCDWTVLVELARDAWLATAKTSPARARLVVEFWIGIEYPLFRRLALFAATEHLDIIKPKQALDWLLMDANCWLWSAETQREAMRQLVVLGAKFDDGALKKLERVILDGPPREMFKPDLDNRKWQMIKEKNIWLRLAKLKQARAKLSQIASDRVASISKRYPNLQLQDNQREEFPVWTSSSDDFSAQDFSTYEKSPVDHDSLVNWLREKSDPERLWGENDDWGIRCHDDFDIAVSALTTLANENCWPEGRWNEALLVWSKEEFLERSWQRVAPLLIKTPESSLLKFSYSMSAWLESLAKKFIGDKDTFFKLCDQILDIQYEMENDIDDPLDFALNHPIGKVTEALLIWWYHTSPKHGQCLNIELRERFTRLCDPQFGKFQHGRVLLARNAVSLFKVDQAWTRNSLLPLFEWKNPKEAKLTWEGFLSSPQVHAPFLEALEPAFLDTAKHCSQFPWGRLRNYVSLLVSCGLDTGIRDCIGIRPLADAMQNLPQDALDIAADTFFRNIESAADQSAEYWKNRAWPYLDAVWPKANEKASEQIAQSFFCACIASGDAFPQALGQVKPWLRNLSTPNRVAVFLHEQKWMKPIPRKR